MDMVSDVGAGPRPIVAVSLCLRPKLKSNEALCKWAGRWVGAHAGSLTVDTDWCTRTYPIDKIRFALSSEAGTNTLRLYCPLQNPVDLA